MHQDMQLDAVEQAAEKLEERLAPIVYDQMGGGGGLIEKAS
jgi:hypothetical protein